ncbi:MAG: type II secretion system F family protein [Acidimicrobiales bacterium]|nr:type II secretion system F family protein [Acidimicrobiales bacterium]
MLLLALIGIAVAIALVAFMLLSQAEEKAVVRSSLRNLSANDVENIRDQELLDPIGQRAVVPVVKGLGSFGRRFTPTGYLDNVRQKFASLGHVSEDDIDRYLAVRVLTVVAIPVAFVLIVAFLPVEGMLRLAVLGLVGLALLLGPDAILNRRVEERQMAIRIALPDLLDLLVISVEAGLGFEQALDRTVAAVPGPLSDEFRRMLGQVRAGASRADAMRALEQRVDVPELRSFVLAILQADTFGVSIGRVLRTQADEMRIKRRQLAQERAMKAPVKMLIPMVFCIFPALFVITLGPAMINIMENF